MVELKIPNEWVKINISDIADVDLGKTPKKSDYLNAGDHKVVKFRDVDYTGIDWSIDKNGFVGEKSIDGLRELKLHDVLITASAHSSEHIGRKICFVNKLPRNYRKIFYCGELLGISPKTGYLSAKYCFYYFLSHTGYKEVQSHVKGVHLTSGQARNMSFPFTPQPEQDRIIEIVEELFSDLDNAIENLKKAQEQLKIYRQAVLKTAFEGKLVISNSKWHQVNLGDLGEWLGGGTPSKSNMAFWNNGTIPWVSPKDMKTDQIVDSQDHITESAIKNSTAKMISSGAILVVVRSGILQHSFPVAVATVACAVNQDLKALVPTTNYSPAYIAWALRAFSSDILHKCSKEGTTVQSIEFPIFKRFSIPIPENIKDQERVVSKIEAMLSNCDKFGELIVNSLDQSESLRQSILKQAFEGRLTEQWRKKHKDLISGENSAEALLKKIKAEKEAMRAKPKGKKKYD